jgi:hypothetical protein
VAHFGDDLGDEELESLLGSLKRGVERRRSLVASNEDISGTHESLDGQWGEWMCPDCGVFMHEDRRRCLNCGSARG